MSRALYHEMASPRPPYKIAAEPPSIGLIPSFPATRFEPTKKWMVTLASHSDSPTDDYGRSARDPVRGVLFSLRLASPTGGGRASFPRPAVFLRIAWHSPVSRRKAGMRRAIFG
jgi:hypothetical protein